MLLEHRYGVSVLQLLLVLAGVASTHAQLTCVADYIPRS